MTEIEKSPRGLPPLPKLFNDIAQLWPAILPNPIWRGSFPPGRMIEAVPVVRVRMAFLEVDMGVVISKDRARLGSLDSRVVTVVNSPNLGSAPIFSYLEKLLNVDE